MVSSVAACCVQPMAHVLGLLCIVNGDDPAVFRFLSLVTLTFELGRDFCTVYLTAKFSRSEVIVWTNN